MRYIVLRVGWIGERRIHQCLVHIDIIDSKIVIQENNTEDLIKTGLVEKDIPEEKICLGFIPVAAWNFVRPAKIQPMLTPV